MTPTDTRHTRSVRFHGLRLTVTAESEVLTALAARLVEFPVAGSEHAPHLRFEYYPFADERSQRVQRPSGSGRTVLDLTGGSVDYFETSEELYVDLGQGGRALCALRTQQVEVAYPGAEPRSAWLCSHPLFTIPLAELLKRAGLYMLHAAGLADGGRGLLVAGASGAGKTTLCLTLLRAGFGFLADDTVFLTRGSGGVTDGKPVGVSVLAFPDEVDLTEQTAAFFPELQSPDCAPPALVRPKRPLCATRLYGVNPTWECQPVMLVFPQISPVPASVLLPMSKDEAFLQLLCNVVRTEVDSSQAHLDALAMLVRQCECYRLHAGRDFLALPELFRSALARAGT
jgi:hypothetical protein